MFESRWRLSITRLENSTSPRPVTASGSHPTGRKIPAISGVIGALLLGVSLHSSAAFAFGPAPQEADEDSVETVRAPGERGAPQPESSTASGSITRTDKYQEGYQYGGESAARIVTNVRAKTVGREGCSGVSAMENALVSVVRTIRPPRSTASGGATEDQFVQGYFRGYYDRIREGIHEARESCSALQYDDGVLPGRLAGAFLCSSASFSLDWVIGGSFEMEPVYAEWHGGAQFLSNDCEAHAEVELVSCGLENSVTTLTAQLAASCR